MAQTFFQHLRSNQTTRQTNLTSGDSDSSLSTLAETVFFSCFYLVISLTAMFGNLLVMVAIFVQSNLQTTSNYLLANLALTDFLQGFVSVPLRVAETLTWKTDVKLLCQISIPLSILFGSTSNVNILFISVERFVAIFMPYFYYEAVTPNFIFAVIGTSWIMITVLALAPSVGLGGLNPSPPVTICRFTTLLSKEYITTLYIIVHFIPITTVILIYGFILRASVNHNRRIHAQERFVVQPRNNEEVSNTKSTETLENTPEDRRNSIKQMKAARIVSFVVGFFIVLVVPIIVIDVVEMFGGPKAPSVLVKIAVCMIYTNHCVNVFVYAGCNRDYRRAFGKIFRKIREFFSKCDKQ
ncbi:probable G-protein coupled receptor No9 [Actinia tenebrosa]|uniref:Probable G-protein coupled receptor No9 n=1 Tax=Actinia tenebrosa TaxID=6105 RepID=A0A6P8HS81_ACTTE|nr:probable G-protein coupled receptor No9 [Actinia tenebrosa]